MVSLTYLDKKLSNYFGNSSMLRRYQKKLKSHDRKDLLSSKFSNKCKKGFPRNFRRSWIILKVNHKNLLDEHDHFFLSLHLHQVYFVSNIMWKLVGLTTLNILRTTRAMSMNCCIVNTP